MNAASRSSLATLALIFLSFGDGLAADPPPRGALAREEFKIAAVIDGREHHFDDHDHAPPL